jgi:peptide deformylase
MAVLELVKFPDPLLHETCLPVEDFDAGLEILATNMAATMLHHKGAGLAAPQVGALCRVVCISDRSRVLAMVNPRYVKRSASKSSATEGCLSIPNRKFHVQRHKQVKVQWEDITGETHVGKFNSWEARAIQHEIDHLDGRLIGGL